MVSTIIWDFDGGGGLADGGRHEVGTLLFCCVLLGDSRNPEIRSSRNACDSVSSTDLITMIFPFTFTSLLTYPFSSQLAEEDEIPDTEPIHASWLRVAAESASAPPSTNHPPRRRLPRPPRRVFDDSIPSEPLQRKRGWEPPSTTTLAATTTTRNVVVGKIDVYGGLRNQGGNADQS